VTRMTLGLLTLVGSLLFVACASGPHSTNRDGWRKARVVLEGYLRDKYGDQWTIRDEVAGTPYLFRVDTAGEAVVLVHDGQVVTQRGLAALDRYLRGSRSIEARTTTLKDMLTLLHLLEFYPPGTKPLGYFRATSAAVALRPRLDFLDGGSATLTLYYRPPHEDDGDVESEEEETEGVMVEWTLRMDPGQMPVWTQRLRRWSYEQKVFIDVDHAN
jgi:hypothetical protein